jgi:7,8-dihydropterin-6-yl-methyl-4-(beta-D-ribofuranosyl)aminobenzene 5'-phosphate synthase
MPRSRLLCLCLAFALPSFAADSASAPHAAPAQVKSLKITILSTMLADGGGIGEWGFAALVEADGHRLLFDTGAHNDVVRRNAASLKVDLTTVPDVILSHSHDDHTGGFLPLRRSVMAAKSTALARTYVGLGIFYPRAAGRHAPLGHRLLALKSEYETAGGSFVVCEKPVQLFPGVWLTGPVPRKYPERNWSGRAEISGPAGRTEDNLPEDMALICDTKDGLVVLTGCGHAGVINLIDYARTIIRPAPVLALIGGIHLFNASDDTLKWTGDKLREFGVTNLLGAHCTGVETVYRLRRDLALDRARAVVGAVGASFELGRGLNPGTIAK